MRAEAGELFRIFSAVVVVIHLWNWSPFSLIGLERGFFFFFIFFFPQLRKAKVLSIGARFLVGNTSAIFLNSLQASFCIYTSIHSIHCSVFLTFFWDQDESLGVLAFEF